LSNGIEINLDHILGFGGEGCVVRHRKGFKLFKQFKAVKFANFGRSEIDEIANISKVSHKNVIKLDSWGVLFNKRQLPYNAYG
jgi:hypothetical protein